MRVSADMIERFLVMPESLGRQGEKTHGGGPPWGANSQCGRGRPESCAAPAVTQKWYVMRANRVRPSGSV
ncbi:hypothetical protein PCAU_2139 [Pseudomonas chlororaphis subsp. aurantiaca]|nr:hypothetical protein PCAU_2139 [Pseudomonas chlororaphis subsp. aurantiaca]